MTAPEGSESRQEPAPSGLVLQGTLGEVLAAMEERRRLVAKYRGEADLALDAWRGFHGPAVRRLVAGALLVHGPG